MTSMTFDGSEEFVGEGALQLAKPDMPEDDGHLRLTMTVGDDEREFRLADRVGIMPLMQFARIARKGTRANDMDAMGSMLDFIEQAIHPDDWDDFVDWTTAVRADTEELLQFVRHAIGQISARPTQPRSSSQGGSRTTPESSQDVSSSVASSTSVENPGPVMRDPRILALVPLAQAV